MTEPLPVELRLLADRSRQKTLHGVTLYQRHLQDIPPERLSQLVDQEWLTKRVVAFDRSGDEELEIEQDPDDGTWWDDNGQQVHAGRLQIHYLTTPKTATACDRDPQLARSRITNEILRLSVELGNLQGESIHAGLTNEALRLELAFGALRSTLPDTLLKTYVKQLQRRG